METSAKLHLLWFRCDKLSIQLYEICCLRDRQGKEENFYSVSMITKVQLTTR